MRISIVMVVFSFLQMAYHSNAQSTLVVYSENFDSGPGGWIIGGYQPSWSFGMPSLPFIASNGTNCFTTGDAGVASAEPYATCLPVTAPTTNGNYYNCCERSFVESPVINLSGITSPMISLDINMHCEQTFDGAKMQISLNGGVSWQDIGSYNSATYQVFPTALNCREHNWYNKNNVSYLNGTGGGCSAVSFSFGGGNSGWSGGCAQSTSGACLTNDSHGTNGWITATHCIPQAANQSSFKVRIAFGSGSQVYSDGIAFDNVKISAVFPVVNFTGNPSAACGPTYEFTNTTDCGQSWTWDFGHPNDPGNNSTDQNPIHEFPAPGNYNVTLTATDFCGGTVTFSQPVTITPGNAPVITNITPTGTLLCDSASGSISIALSPIGTPPYTFSYFYNNISYSSSGLTGNPVILTGLYPGTYSSFSIQDANGCDDAEQSLFMLPFNGDNLVVEASGDTMLLPGEATMLSVSSNISADFLWSPASSLDDPHSVNPIASPFTTTEYTVVATDINGCVASSQVTVFINDSQPCEQYFFPNTFTPNGDGKNDLFQTYSDLSMNLTSFKMTIYDRWGKVMFQTKEINEGWSGKSMPEGIYMVIADFECHNKKASRYTGILNLIR